MDTLAEQLVKKQDTSADTLKKTCIIGIAALIVVISLILLVFGYAIAILLIIGAVWGARYFLKMQDVEYEYSCTNGIFDVDKIMGQSKRKSLLSVEVKTFTKYSKSSALTGEEDVNLTVFSVTGESQMGGTQPEEYYAEFPHPEYGKCCIYFNPDDNFRKVLEPYLPREIKAKLK